MSRRASALASAPSSLQWTGDETGPCGGQCSPVRVGLRAREAPQRAGSYSREDEMSLRWTRLLCVALLGVLLATPAAAQKANWPKSLTLGTASVGGTFFIYGQVWATLAGDTI